MNGLRRIFSDIKQGDNIDLYVTVLIALVVAVLNLLGIAPPSLVQTLSLSVLALLVSSILGLRHRIENATEKISQVQKDSAHFIIESLDGVETVTFPSEVDCLKYITERISQAEIRIDDLSWSVGSHGSHPLSPALNENYLTALNDAIQRVGFREVLIFNTPARVEKLRRRIADNWFGYSCAYYDIETAKTPLLQFMIIDEREVIFLTDAYTSNLAIRHPQIVKMFVEYYNDIWQKALKLKEGNKIYKERVDAILKNDDNQSAA